MPIIEKNSNQSTNLLPEHIGKRASNYSKQLYPKEGSSKVQSRSQCKREEKNNRKNINKIKSWFSEEIKIHKPLA